MSKFAEIIRNRAMIPNVIFLIETLSIYDVTKTGSFRLESCPQIDQKKKKKCLTRQDFVPCGAMRVE